MTGGGKGTASRRRIRAAAVTLCLALAGPAAAQSWQPLGMSEPFPPTGTRVCAEGGGDRFCLALYCPGPGTGLRIGWLDTTRAAMTDGAELFISVDNPLAAPDFNDPAPDAIVVRMPRPPYFAAIGTLNPVRADRLLAAMRAGNTVTVDDAGNGVTLPLRGSSREISRALALCGPPATDPVWQTVGNAAPSPEPTAVAPDPAPPAASGPPPAISATWRPTPPDPQEDTTGTEICFGDALDPSEARCLRVGCFAPGTDAILWWQDERQPATGGEVPLTITGPGGTSETVLSFVPAPDAPYRIGTGPLGADALRSLGADGALTLTLAGADWRVATTGAAGELARVGAVCAFPDAPPLPPAAATPAASPGATAAPRGLLRVALPEVDLATLDADARAAFDATQGETVATYERVVGGPVQQPGVALYLLGGERRLLFTRLCGGGGFFGASGCVVDVFAGDGGGWRTVFFATGSGDTFDLDLDRMTDGWPEIVVNGGAARWGWTGGGYAIR